MDIAQLMVAVDHLLIHVFQRHDSEVAGVLNNTHNLQRRYLDRHDTAFLVLEFGDQLILVDFR